MTPHREEMIRRFGRRHIGNHLVMMSCFLGLVLTGLPQMFASHNWAKGIVMIFGGVERVRLVHHWLGTIMALQLVWHFLEALWFHMVRRRPMAMVPHLSDLANFMQQIRYNLGLVGRPPEMDRYTFAEKLEYLALVWGTVLMVLTGLILLYPVRWSALFPGEAILAAKAAHGGEAVLALLSILTWHMYFVHIRHWNTSMFTGKLEAEEYAAEHALELQRIRRAEVAEPTKFRAWRLVGVAMSGAAIVAGVWLFYSWLRDATPAVLNALGH
jgi:formate dehydrogenase subunit gamma